MVRVASSNASAQLHAIAAVLKARGEKGMRAELIAGLKAGAAPLKLVAQHSAFQRLPKAGGLNVRVANEPIRVSVLTGARTAEVRLLQPTTDAAKTNLGLVRHPVYGRWLPNQPDQVIPAAAGWWTDSLAQASPAVTPHLIAVMERIAAQIRSA